MKCNISLIPKFLDDELNESQRNRFINHLAECPSCRQRTESCRKLAACLSEEHDIESPSSDSVMKRLDINRYSKPAMNGKFRAWNLSKTCRKAAVPAVSIALAGILLAIPLTRDFIGRGLMTLLDKQSRIVQGTVSGSSGILEFSGSFEQITGQALVSELNAKGMGVSPWEVLYASPERIILRNYASLLVYSGGEIKKVAELDTLGLDHVQGSIVTLFEISSDGRYILAGNQIPQGEGTPQSSGIYLIDADTGRYMKLYESGINSFASAWSFNGQWLALAPKNDADKIDILDLKTLKETKASIPSTEIQSLFISDSGRPAFYTGARVYLPMAADINRWNSVSQTKIPFYIQADSGTIWFIEDGYISSQDFGSDVIQSHMITGSEDKGAADLVTDARVQGKYLVSLLESGQVSLLDLGDHSEKRFGTKNRISSSHLPWCAVSSGGESMLWEVTGGLVFSNGVQEIIHESPYAVLNNVRWKDENNLVSVNFLNDSDIKAGEFAIMQMNALTEETTEIFRTTEPAQEPQKSYHNRVYVKDESLAYSQPDTNAPLVEEIVSQLSDPTRIHELNLFDEVVSGFVHAENDEGLSGWVREEDFIYYDNYKNFSYEKNTLDLNGDSKPDTINVNGYDNYRLEINDDFIEGSGITVSNQFRVVDIDPEDPYLEIVIEEFGPSSDTMSSFYYYDGTAVRFMGKIEGLCGNKDSVKGDGQIIGRTRGNILETWFYSDYYILDEQRKLVQVPQQVYMKITYPQAPPLKVLIPSLSLVEAPESKTVSLTLKQGDEIYFLGSDNKEWCLFGTSDGKKGWMCLTDFNKSADLDLRADEIFEGLSHAD